MSDLNLDALEAVAQAATPGPWKRTYDRRSIYSIADVHPGGGIAGSLMSHGAKFASASDAAHIATFDPPTVLALIAELRDSRARIAEVEAERDEWRDVSVGPAYATLLRERTQAAEQKVAALEAERDQWRETAGEMTASYLAANKGWVQAAAALGWVRGVREHYANPTAFPVDGVVPVASIVSRLDTALAAAPTPPAEAEEQRVREAVASLQQEAHEVHAEDGHMTWCTICRRAATSTTEEAHVHD